MNLSKDLKLLSKVLPYITLDIIAFVMNLKIIPSRRSRSTVPSSLQDPRPNLEGGSIGKLSGAGIFVFGRMETKDNR